MKPAIIIKRTTNIKELIIHYELIKKGDLDTITLEMLRNSFMSHLPLAIAYINDKPVGQYCSRVKMTNVKTEEYYDEYLKTDDYIVLSFINTLNKYKKKGVGTLLVEDFIKSKYKKVLRVSVENDAAYRLYLKQGFVKINTYADKQNDKWHVMIYKDLCITNKIL